MAKDRPWNRQPDTKPTKKNAKLTKEDVPNLTEVSDGEVRAYCLERARGYLWRNHLTAGDSMGTKDLERAAHYAAIALAFRPDREQE